MFFLIHIFYFYRYNYFIIDFISYYNSYFNMIIVLISTFNMMLDPNLITLKWTLLLIFIKLIFYNYTCINYRLICCIVHTCIRMYKPAFLLVAEPHYSKGGHLFLPCRKLFFKIYLINYISNEENNKTML